MTGSSAATNTIPVQEIAGLARIRPEAFFCSVSRVSRTSRFNPSPLCSVQLDRDGFLPGQSIVTNKALRQIAFAVENRTGDAHATSLLLSPPAGTSYTVLQDGQPISLLKTSDWDHPLRAELKIVPGKNSRIEVMRR